MGVRRGQALRAAQERAEARPLYARSHRGTPATSGADAAIAHTDSRHRTALPCLGREGGRVRCAVVFIVVRGLTSFLAVPAQHSVKSVFWIFGACESAPLPLP